SEARPATPRSWSQQGFGSRLTPAGACTITWPTSRAQSKYAQARKQKQRLARREAEGQAKQDGKQLLRKTRSKTKADTKQVLRSWLKQNEPRRRISRKKKNKKKIYPLHPPRGANSRSHVHLQCYHPNSSRRLPVTIEHRSRPSRKLKTASATTGSWEKAQESVSVEDSGSQNAVNGSGGASNLAR